VTNEERLELLERELQRTKRHNRYLLGALLVIIGIGILGAAPFQQAKEIHASKLFLEDDNGKTLAILGKVTGDTGLFLYDKNGDLQASLYGEMIIPNMTTTGDKGPHPIDFGPHLYFYENKNPCLMLSARRICLFHNEGKLSETIWEAPDSTP